jgi:hypothetical protein
MTPEPTLLLRAHDRRSPLRCYNSSTKVSATKVASNLNKTCCDLDLTDQKEDPLVAFMSTLTDGYFKP